MSQLNVVSLRKHMVELAKLMHDHELDVLGLNETRLSKTYATVKFQLRDMTSIDTIGTPQGVA